MSSSLTGITSLMGCSICSEHVHSLCSLHEHHLSCHSAEELSLALISYKVPEQTIVRLEDKDLQFTQLCKAQTQCNNIVASSQNAKVTAHYENTIGKNIQYVESNKKGILNVINSDEDNVEMCSQSNTNIRKLNKFKNTHKGDILLCNTEPELDTSTCSDNEQDDKISLELNETSTNDDIKPEVRSNSSTQHAHNNISKRPRRVEKEIPETESITHNHGFTQSKNSYEDLERAVFLDMECVDDLGKLNVEKTSEDVSFSSVAANTSTDSELPFDSISQSEMCVQAIITRLSNIVKPTSEPLEDRAINCKQDVSKKYEKHYILPSPLRKCHYSQVSYNYGSLHDNEMCLNDSINDFIVPTIKMDGFKDATCETIPTDFSEKEVQVDLENTVPFTDNNINLQANNVEAVEKEQHDEYTQTGIISLTTRRLAAYRKPLRSLPLMDDNSRLLNNDPGTISTVFTKSPDKRSQMYLRMNTDRRFFCELCGKGYKKKSHLERHVRVHTGERPFPCPYCEKRFAVRSILKQHVRTHTGEKPYSCSLCFQRFPQKSGLMTHTMLHTGKPFKCDKCEKAFVSNHKLLQHLRSHNNKTGRKYPCSVCKTEFLTESAMLHHRHIHNSKPLFLSCNFSKTLFSK